MQWQPDGSTIRANKWFLGAGFLGAPPISLTGGLQRGQAALAVLRPLALRLPPGGPLPVLRGI